MPRDIWQTDLFESSYGGLRIDITEIQDEGGRVLVPFESPGRDGAALQDTGGEPRVTTCKVVFLQTSATDDPMSRFRALEQLKREGQTLPFVHPLTGTYQAKIGRFSYAADADHRGLVTVDLTFHEDTLQPAVFEAQVGTEALAGLEEVKVSSAELDDGLVDIEEETGVALETTVGADAVELATTWTQAEPDSLTERDVKLALDAATNQLEAESERLELATEIDRYPLLVSFTRLQYSLRKLAEAVITDSPRLVEWRPKAPTSLLAFCQRYYGAASAEARADQIERLNDIVTPHRIEPPAVLRVPAASTSARLRSPL
jgi:prophage DNA circulation protein